MRNLIRPAIVSFSLLTVVTGVIYPLAVTAVAQLAFAKQANGSLSDMGDGKRASTLIGQQFTSEKYFWPRPSAAGTFAYNPLGSAGSNLATSNPALATAVQDRRSHLQAAHGDGSVPVDLLTGSASGLDPHISPAAAEYQIGRVAKARGMSAGDLRALIAQHTEQPTLGILGEARVNVLELNVALDR